VEAGNARIQASLSLLSSVIQDAADSARQGLLTTKVLEQLVLRAGLFPYIPWQVRGRGW
jgi:hypothetical protein